MIDELRPAVEPLRAAVYLTAAEVAELLRLSVKSVYRLVESDPSMPALRLNGKTVRWPRERLMRWLREREQGAGRAR